MAGAGAIRPAREGERPVLIGLMRQASLMWEEDREDLLAHPEVFDVPESQIAEGHVFVFASGEAVLGFAVVLPRDDGAAELDGLFVDPACWGRGIGRRLTEHAVEVARGRGAISLNVVANKRAAGFYAACGFTEEGEVPTRFNPALAMVRRL